MTQSNLNQDPNDEQHTHRSLESQITSLERELNQKLHSTINQLTSVETSVKILLGVASLAIAPLLTWLFIDVQSDIKNHVERIASLEEKVIGLQKTIEKLEPPSKTLQI